MRIKEYKRLKNTKAMKYLIAFLNNHQQYHNTYFWNPPGHASARRKMDFDTEFVFIYHGVKYELRQSLSCSCKNVYFSSKVYVDGIKKNIRTVKKLIDSSGYNGKNPAKNPYITC